MVDRLRIANHFAFALRGSPCLSDPYRHWLVNSPLTFDACAAIDALPIAPPPAADTLGRRETNNSTRQFFGENQRVRHPACDSLAAALQSHVVVNAIEECCGLSLRGTSLRIEYALDTNGFWLAPHTDIGVKRFTMLIYLSNDPGSEAWGTDIYHPDGTHAARSPYYRNSALIFIPSTTSWHGFEPRPIIGVRRSLIVNYVGPEWRARQELAFPNQPVGHRNSSVF